MWIYSRPPGYLAGVMRTHLVQVVHDIFPGRPFSEYGMGEFKEIELHMKNILYSYTKLDSIVHARMEDGLIHVDAVCDGNNIRII